MDNSYIHRHQMILALIKEAGRQVMFRAPYWLCDGPIEYAFNTIHGNGANSLDDLAARLDNNIFLHGRFFCYAYYAHAGFP
ncbi:hypothetical protein ACHAWF_013729 [Thalassiosira exigua]